MTGSNIGDGQQTQDRHIEIRRDVINSAIVSGDNNIVVIYQSHLDQQVQIGNPYRGLAAFEVEDADVYFGREREVDRLWNRFWNLYEQSQHDKLLPRLLPILGPSGSGKSSLARAGLLPELARRPLPGHKQTRVLIVKPGDTPLEKLALILARIATGDSSPMSKTEEFKEVLEKRHEQGTNDGLSFIASMLPEQDYPLVVLVDQFEEIYSSNADPKQRAAFVETLLEASVTRKAQISVVLTLRSDFLGETQRHPKLNRVIGSDQSVFLPVMTRDELHLAIEKPAEQAGHPLDFATVDQLVEQTEGREGALPLLQFALQRIWQELSNSNFSKSSKDILRDIGGIGGALAGEAERIFKSLNSQEQDIARRVFIGLVQIGEGIRYTRRRVKIKDLLTKKDTWEQVWKVLDRFSSPSTRLITLSSIDGEEVAEVTHEALFETWQQLRGWLDDQRDRIRQQQRINALAEEWDEQGKKRGYLLQGRQLDDAKDFQKRYGGMLPPSALAVELLSKSLMQRWVNRAMVVSLAVIPFIAVEAFLREEAVKRDYATLWGGDIARKPQAVLALSAGCDELRGLDGGIRFLKERIFGNCRPLRMLDLRQVNLSGTDLDGVNFISANLSKANLSRSFLGHAKFNGADLSGTDFTGAQLTGADFGGANLRGANLSNTNLFVVNLRGANLHDADLRGALMWSIEDFREELSHAKLCQTKFSPEVNLDPNRDCANMSILSPPLPPSDLIDEAHRDAMRSIRTIKP